MGTYQRAAMWLVGIMLTLGFVGDAIDYFFFEDPSEFNVFVEALWVLLFLAILSVIEGVLWLIFRAYNRWSPTAKGARDA